LVDFYNLDDNNLVGGTFIANGAAVSGAPTYHAGGKIEIEGAASEGSYIVNGATAAGGDAGEMTMEAFATAGAAFITVNAGENGGAGGSLTLKRESLGGTARIAVYGNGFLNPNLLDDSATIGSLEGDGLVLLGKRALTIGSNDLSTIFSGNIEDTGAISKIGSGTLTLTTANSYSGGTTIAGGSLLVSNASGSETGAGAVSVAAGTLGGSGIISGPVTCGTGSGSGAFLAPSEGATTPVTFTIQSALTLADDATYLYKLDTDTVKADEVIAKGVVIESGAMFSLLPGGSSRLAPGLVFTVINNTASTPITGTFQNLTDGAILTLNGSNLQASYTGGDGNDLTLTVLP
jgi:autotransporter-associated beta strand protein